MGEDTRAVHVRQLPHDCLDLGVDRVAKALKTTNKWDDALLLFTADNGANLGGKQK